MKFFFSIIALLFLALFAKADPTIQGFTATPSNNNKIALNGQSSINNVSFKITVARTYITPGGSQSGYYEDGDMQISLLLSFPNGYEYVLGDKTLTSADYIGNGAWADISFDNISFHSGDIGRVVKIKYRWKSSTTGTWLGPAYKGGINIVADNRYFTTTGNVNLDVVGFNIKEVGGMYDPTQSRVFGTSNTTPILTRGQQLFSQNGNFRMELQNDGNLVIVNLQNSKVLWASNTNGKNANYLILQPDGNLILYTQISPYRNGVIWANNIYSTYGNASSAVQPSDTKLIFQNDGNLILGLPEQLSNLMGIIGATRSSPTNPSSHFGKLK